MGVVIDLDTWKQTPAGRTACQAGRKEVLGGGVPPDGVCWCNARATLGDGVCKGCPENEYGYRDD